jgi:4-amino-4-deoxy-L-arabinose transferase-like glycosyltransferase
MKPVSYIKKPVSIIFTVIIVFAILVRFTSLSSLPVSLYWDEVSEGYNSYSILQTGKDEYGTSFPLLFRGYDDDKMPVYIYLSIIPIALFGLGEFSVRFTSAFFGVGSVIICFFLVKELFKKEKLREITALFSCLLFSIVPWHVQLSRAGFEANVALFFVMLGSYLVLKSRDEKWYLMAASFSFVLSIYTYRSSLIVIPLLFFVFLIILRKKVMKSSMQKVTLLSLLTFILLSLPLIFIMTSKGDPRSSEVSIFVAENPKLQEVSIKQAQAGSTIFAKIIYNRRLVYAEQAAKNYFSHFSPTFLFLKGDINPRHSVGNVGQLYFWQLPFVVAGVLYLLKKHREQAYFLLAWLLLSPLPASFSFPAPHALRSLLMLPPLIIFSACGVYYVYIFFRSKMKLLFFVVMAFIMICSSLMFAKSYLIHNSITASNDWGDGYKPLIRSIKPQIANFDKVIISGHYWQPYMYTLFYTQYDPKLFQQEGNQVSFAKFIFGGTSWDRRLHRQELDNVDLGELSGSKKVLVALSPGEYQSQKQHIKKSSEIKNHKGEVIFIVGTLKE